jgi:hypothetical protein
MGLWSFRFWDWPELPPEQLVVMLFAAGLWVGLLGGLTIGQRAAR